MLWSERVIIPLVLTIGLTAGCSTAPASQEAKDDLVRRATAALGEWNTAVPGLEAFARHGYGYAMFPSIGKGGLGLGAAYGRGVVWEQGEHLGYADLSHASVGLQAGGQAYQALVVFDGKAALERFKQGGLDFSAGSSAVLLEGGYVATLRFVDGVTVFSRPIGGAMGEASMGGQWFTFVLRDDRQSGKPVPSAAGTR